MAFKHASSDALEGGKWEVTGTVVALTANAILFNDGIREAWLPRSKITIAGARDLLGHVHKAEPEKGDIIEVLMPQWLAKKERFI